MTATEQTITVAAKLYEVRDTMRTFLGDRFASVMRENGEMLKRIAALKGCSVLDTAIQVAADLQRQGQDIAVLTVLAAAVETEEPTKRKKST